MTRRSNPNDGQRPGDAASDANAPRGAFGEGVRRGESILDGLTGATKGGHQHRLCCPSFETALRASSG